MVTFYYMVIVTLLCMLIRVSRENISMKKELQYISEQIQMVVNLNKNNFIMVRTENKEIKAAVKKINYLLSAYYQKEIEYKKQNQLVLQMMTNISHDLRTPFTVLAGYIEILNGKVKCDTISSEIKEIVWKISNKIGSCVRMVNQLFDMSKIESGDMKIEMDKHDINAICRETILEYYDLLNEKGFVVKIDISTEPFLVDLDWEAAIRILKNLIDNVIRYAYEGKYLGISVINEEEFVYVNVEDHGNGIEKSKLDKIFYRTYIMDENREKIHQGSGLGLSIARNLARKMNGSLYAESIPGERTRFIWKIKK